jgi:acyl carrier protein
VSDVATILDLVSAYTGTRVEDLKPEMRLQEDLGLDSIDAVEILVEVEASIGVRLEAEELAEMRTLRDVLARLEPSD